MVPRDFRGFLSENMRVNRGHRLCYCVNSSSVCLSLSLSLMSLSLCIRHTCLGKLLRISCLEHVINDLVRSKINFLVGPQEPLSGNCQGMEFCMVRACHTPRQPPQTIRQGTLEGGRNASWTKSKSGYPYPCPPPPPDGPIGQGTELNWIFYISLSCFLCLSLLIE